MAFSHLGLSIPSRSHSVSSLGRLYSVLMSVRSKVMVSADILTSVLVAMIGSTVLLTIIENGASQAFRRRCTSLYSSVTSTLHRKDGGPGIYLSKCRVTAIIGLYLLLTCHSIWKSRLTSTSGSTIGTGRTIASLISSFKQELKHMKEDVWVQT